MTCSTWGWLFCSALLLIGAEAAAKETGKPELVGARASEKNIVVHEASIGGDLTVQAQIQAALSVAGLSKRDLMVMSPVNTMRFALENHDGVAEISLIENKTKQITRRWVIQRDAATDAGLSEIRGVVLTAMGLDATSSRTDKVPSVETHDNVVNPAH